MPTPLVLFTIDVECDHDREWARAKPVTYRSVTDGVAQRLHPLFRRFQARPTYLLTCDVIEDAASRDALGPLADCELGTHLHAGLVGPNAAHALPAAGVQAMEFQCHDAPAVERAKMTTLTEAFRSRFSREPRTFRAGRFAAGSNTIRCLEALGYRVDTSVTPHLRWPHERGAVDFRGAPEQPYFPSPDAVARPTERGAVLEVPVSIRRRFWGEPVWLRPWHSTPEQMRALGDLFLRRHGARPFVVLNMMFHSMEVVPGASPAGQTEDECREYLSMIEDFLRWAGERKARFATASEARDLWLGA